MYGHSHVRWHRSVWHWRRKCIRSENGRCRFYTLRRRQFILVGFVGNRAPPSIKSTTPTMTTPKGFQIENRQTSKATTNQTAPARKQPAPVSTKKPPKTSKVMLPLNQIDFTANRRVCETCLRCLIASLGTGCFAGRYVLSA